MAPDDVHRIAENAPKVRRGIPLEALKARAARKGTLAAKRYICSQHHQCHGAHIINWQV